MKKKMAFQMLLIFLFVSAGTYSLAEELSSQSDLERKNEWSYEGNTGPTNWSDIDEAYILCKTGEEQSPININTSKVIQSSKLKEVTFNYNKNFFQVENNGHTIKVAPLKGENYMTIGDQHYELKQLHFHQPSEHKINGERFPMEIHLVHQNDKGELAVVGIMVKKGESNQVISSLWSNLPDQKGEESITENINLVNLLPEEKDLYRYEGSLTTPPCTQGVNWLIFHNPIEMSENQINTFARLYSDNYRPIQPINKREVYLK